MTVGQICNRHLITATKDSDLTSAAALMREKHVGYVVVVDSEETRRPIGVLTDRDIVVNVVALKADPALLTVGDVMTQRVLITDEQSSLDAALVQMRRNGIRRLPVVGPAGGLVGVLSLDDALQAVVNELDDAVGSIAAEPVFERARHP